MPKIKMYTLAFMPGELLQTLDPSSMRGQLLILLQTVKDQLFDLFEQQGLVAADVQPTILGVE